METYVPAAITVVRRSVGWPGILLHERRGKSGRVDYPGGIRQHVFYCFLKPLRSDVLIGARRQTVRYRAGDVTGDSRLRLKSSVDEHERNRPNNEQGKSEDQTSSLQEKSIHTHPSDLRMPLVSSRLDRLTLSVSRCLMHGACQTRANTRLAITD